MSLRDNRFLRSLYYRWKCYEAKHSYNHGKDNRIKNRGVIIGSRIQFNGRGNELVVEDGAFCSIARFASPEMIAG